MAVAAERRPSLYAVADALRSRAFLATVGTLTVLLFAVGGLAWLAERRRNRKEFEPAPARGLFDGFWWAVVTMTTVGYGDKTPITVPGRLLGVFWMFCAVILTSLVTAQLSAILTAERIVSRVTTISDLSRVRVGNVGIRPRPRRFAPEAYAMVLPQGSPRREAINQPLLEVLASDQWPVTLRYYLGPLD